MKINGKRSSPEPNLQYCWCSSYNVQPRILPMHCYTPALLALELENWFWIEHCSRYLKSWQLFDNSWGTKRAWMTGLKLNILEICLSANFQIGKTLVLIRHFKLRYEIFQLIKPAGKPLCGCSKLCEQLSKPTDWTLKNDLHLMKGQAWKINTLQIIMTLHDSIQTLLHTIERRKVSIFVWSCVSN